MFVNPWLRPSRRNSQWSWRRRGRLGSAALDVLSTEPLAATHELFSTPNVITTPHCATGGTDVQEEKLLFALNNVMAFHEGRETQARLA
jgi:phosphoglycerate dehydrogenase-like enzyme